MKGYMPQEIQVWYILPALRREFARCMVEDFGLTQKEAAEKIGVTEAAISQYFGSKRGRKVEFPEEFSEKVEDACRKILEGGASLSEEIYRLSVSDDVKESMCRVHREEDDSVSEACNICFKYEEW